MDTIEIIAFTDENGEEFPFEVIDRLTYQERQYVVMLPAEDPDCDEFLIMQAVPVNREVEEYLVIEENEVLQAVFALFRERHAGEYQFR